MAAFLAFRHVLFGYSMFPENLILFPAFTNWEIPSYKSRFSVSPEKLEDAAILSTHFEYGGPCGGICALQLAIVPSISLHSSTSPIWSMRAFEFKIQKPVGFYRGWPCESQGTRQGWPSQTCQIGTRENAFLMSSSHNRTFESC